MTGAIGNPRFECDIVPAAPSLRGVVTVLPDVTASATRRGRRGYGKERLSISHPVFVILLSDCPGEIAVAVDGEQK